MATASDYPGAIWAPGPNHYQGRRGYPIRYVVVHGTGWPYTLDQYIAEAHLKGGVNYMIGVDGRVVQMVAESDGSWGNGIIEPGHDPFWEQWTTSVVADQTVPGKNWVDPNFMTISIEHVNMSKTNANAYTDAQYAASIALIDYLCRKYRIPRLYATSVDGGIVGHHSMQPVSRHYCPGNYDFNRLFTALRARNVPPGWRDDGTFLHPAA